MTWQSTPGTCTEVIAAAKAPFQAFSTSTLKNTVNTVGNTLYFEG
jgi:hypothetical protein